MVIFGCTSTMAALLILLLPETLGLHLPETLAQAKLIGSKPVEAPPPTDNDGVSDDGSLSRPLIGEA